MDYRAWIIHKNETILAYETGQSFRYLSGYYYRSIIYIYIQPKQSTSF